MKVHKDWKEFLQLLNDHEVDFLVVGAFAVAYHAIPRYTGDLDIWIRTSPSNAARVLRVIDAFGFASLGLKLADLENPDSIVQLGHRPVRVDVITSISGVTFEEAWPNRVSGEIEGVPVSYPGREDLTRNKIASGREQDVADLKKLNLPVPRKGN